MREISGAMRGEWKDETGDAMAPTPGLVLEGVSHLFGAFKVVDDVHLTVASGEVMCLLGPSGCGKTTTLRIAAGLEHPTAGRVSVGGAVVADRSTNIPPERRRLGFLFQDYALFPHLTVADNVAFGLAGWPAAERGARVAEVLEQVGMKPYAHSYPHMLSGGQQQRVALARALAPKPRLMLLDEPFSGLDTRLRDQVRDQTLHVLKGSGVATLMVTHDPEEAMFMADRIAVMRNGRIVQVGRPVDLYCHPVDAFVTSFFGYVNRLEGMVSEGGVETPFGRLDARNLPDGSAVEILIRPEALHLRPSDEDTRFAAQVVTSRMLGRTSLVHLCVGDVASHHVHLHSRMPGRFLPSEGEIMEVVLDRSQVFVFPSEGTN